MLLKILIWNSAQVSTVNVSLTCGLECGLVEDTAHCLISPIQELLKLTGCNICMVTSSCYFKRKIRSSSWKNMRETVFNLDHVGFNSSHFIFFFQLRESKGMPTIKLRPHCGEVIVSVLSFLPFLSLSFSSLVVKMVKILMLSAGWRNWPFGCCIPFM